MQPSLCVRSLQGQRCWEHTRWHEHGAVLAHWQVAEVNAWLKARNLSLDDKLRREIEVRRCLAHQPALP